MEQFENETSMSSEEEPMFQFDDVASALRVLDQHMLKNFDFYFRLRIELRFIPYDFQGNMFLPFVVECLENLAK